MTMDEMQGPQWHDCQKYIRHLSLGHLTPLLIDFLARLGATCFGEKVIGMVECSDDIFWGRAVDCAGHMST